MKTEIALKHLSLAVVMLQGFTFAELARADALPNVPAFRTSVVGVAQPQFVLATPLPTVPGEVAVMAVQEPKQVADAVADLASRLGMDGKLVRNGRGKLAIRANAGAEDQRTITAFEASAGFFYRYDRALHPIVEQQPKLPSPEEAFEIATKFLLEHDLLPADAVAKPEAVAYHSPELAEFDGKTGRTLRSFTTSIEVRYPQTWGGLPVTGPGSKLYVSLGEGGKVVAVTRMWRSAEPSMTRMPTVAPAEALRGLKVGSYLSVPTGCATARIESFKMAYWAQSPTEMQRIAVPVYQIDGTCLAANGSSLGEFAGFAPAVAKLPVNVEDIPRGNDDVDDQDEG